MAMTLLDLDRFAATPLVRHPFDHLVVPGFLTAEGVATVDRSFPEIDAPGSFPTSELAIGPEFAAFLEALQGTAMTAAFGEKFALDLSQRPTMVTLRGHCQARDGRIHTDSQSKIVTVLIYMNDAWEADGGRLRLLNGPDDLDDMIAEVPPQAGTLIAFRRSTNSYHGHKPHVGRRRAIQLNWVSDAGVVHHEQRRHRISARLKKIKRLFGLTGTEA